MSDLEIDFAELWNISTVDGFQTKWVDKVIEIKNTYKFEDHSQVIHMFNDWVTDRRAGLHV